MAGIRLGGVEVGGIGGDDVVVDPSRTVSNLGHKNEDDDSNTLSSSDFMESLCNLNVLLNVDVMIGREDTEELCSLVKKYVRGQRRGTVVGSILRDVLRI